MAAGRQPRRSGACAQAASSAHLQILLGDAQTSGGLLLCVPEERALEAVQRVHDAGCGRAAAIGKLTPAARRARMRIR
jgi:selenide,water dikinase